MRCGLDAAAPRGIPCVRMVWDYHFYAYFYEKFEPLNRMRVKKALFSASLLFSAILSAAAQDGNLINVGLQARVDYQREALDGRSVKDNCGFKGKNVSILVNGDLGEHFSYNYRQRLYRGHGSESFFNATDFLYLAYRPGERWNFSVGKQIVAIGGYEYDLAPIDIYFLSEYCGNIGCYQMGVTAGYSFGSENGLLRFQFCQSPFRQEDSDMYAYNLMWSGRRGCFESLWSVNLIEYLPGRYINYIALGNHFTFGRLSVFADFMNRLLMDEVSFLKDFTVIGKLTYSFTDRLSVFGKASYDRNDLGKEGDWCVYPGTSIGRIGCGVEYFPLSDNRVRIHAAFCHSFGDNGNPAGGLLPDHLLASAGLTWRMSLLGR